MTTSRRARLGLAGLSAIALTTLAGAGSANAAGPDWGFTPLTNPALKCWDDSTGTPNTALPINIGDPIFASALTPTKLMSAGDAATKVSDNSVTTIGRENDMIALSPDGQFLYTPSENATPSDGISRYTLTGPNIGKKEILTTGPAPGTLLAPAWSRMDGMIWYTPSNVILGS